MTLRQMRMQDAARKAQQEAQQKSDAQWAHNETLKEWANPARWKGTTPKEQGAALATINSARNTLGLAPMNALPDPRPEAAASLYFEQQKLASAGIGVGPDGKPSGMLLTPFEAMFDEDWLHSWNVDNFNHEQLGSAGIPPAQGSGTPGVPSPSPSPVATGEGKAGASSAAPGQAGAESATVDASNQAGAQGPIKGDWRTRILSSLGEVANRPLTRDERIEQHNKNVQAYVLATKNPEVKPEQLAAWRGKIQADDKTLGLDTNLDLFVGAAGSPQMTPYQTEEAENSKLSRRLTMEQHLLTEIKDIAHGTKNLDESEARTRSLREALYDVRAEMGIHPKRKPGELPEHYASVDPMTLQQESQLALGSRRADISQQNANTAAERAENAKDTAAANQAYKNIRLSLDKKKWDLNSVLYVNKQSAALEKRKSQLVQSIQQGGIADASGMITTKFDQPTLDQKKAEVGQIDAMIKAIREKSATVPGGAEAGKQGDAVAAKVQAMSADRRINGKKAANILRQAGASEDEIKQYMNTYFWGRNGRPRGNQ
jgi:hypothetical protein